MINPRVVCVSEGVSLSRGVCPILTRYITHSGPGFVRRSRVPGARLRWSRRSGRRTSDTPTLFDREEETCSLGVPPPVSTQEKCRRRNQVVRREEGLYWKSFLSRRVRVLCPCSVSRRSVLRRRGPGSVARTVIFNESDRRREGGRKGLGLGETSPSWTRGTPASSASDLRSREAVSPHRLRNRTGGRRRGRRPPG